MFLQSFRCNGSNNDINLNRLNVGQVGADHFLEHLKCFHWTQRLHVKLKCFLSAPKRSFSSFFARWILQYPTNILGLLKTFDSLKASETSLILITGYYRLLFAYSRLDTQCKNFYFCVSSLLSYRNLSSLMMHSVSVSFTYCFIARSSRDQIHCRELQTLCINKQNWLEQVFSGHISVISSTISSVRLVCVL